MFRAELEMFAESCRTGRQNLLNARNGNVAVAVVYAALRSIDHCIGVLTPSRSPR